MHLCFLTRRSPCRSPCRSRCGTDPCPCPGPCCSVRSGSSCRSRIRCTRASFPGTARRPAEPGSHHRCRRRRPGGTPRRTPSGPRERQGRGWCGGWLWLIFEMIRCVCVYDCVGVCVFLCVRVCSHVSVCVCTYLSARLRACAIVFTRVLLSTRVFWLWVSTRRIKSSHQTASRTATIEVLLVARLVGANAEAPEAVSSTASEKDRANIVVVGYVTRFAGNRWRRMNT